MPKRTYCPHCGGGWFRATVTGERECQIEDGWLVYAEYQENARLDVSELRCTSCGQPYPLDQVDDT